MIQQQRERRHRGTGRSLAGRHVAASCGDGRGRKGERADRKPVERVKRVLVTSEKSLSADSPASHQAFSRFCLFDSSVQPDIAKRVISFGRVREESSSNNHSQM